MRSKDFVPSCLAILASVSGVAANNPIDGSLFHNENGRPAAMAAVPMYHFGRPRGTKPCYPESAQINGKQTDGNNPDQGIYRNLGAGCNDPGNWNGVMNQGNPFPIYYTIQQCADHEFRVAYSIYFKHDSSHKSDWENVIVVWNGDQNNKWTRKEILLGFHSTWTRLPWESIQNTVDGDSDKFTQDAKNRDHPKVYVGAFKHATFHTRKTNIDFWPSAQNDEFRSNDWYMLPWADLVQPGTLIPAGWDWGSADTNPASLRQKDGAGNKWICSR